MKLLIIDDHRAVADALEMGLAAEGYEVMASSGDDGVVSLCAEFGPDVVLLDLDLGEDRSGIDLLPELEAEGRAIIVLTGLTGVATLAAAFEAGADAVVDKGTPFPKLIEEIEAAMAGESTAQDAYRHEVLHRAKLAAEERSRVLAPFESLTGREREVLAMLVQGESASTIADALFLSMATVRSHIQSILMKLGVNSQLAAVSMAVRAGWLPRMRHPAGGGNATVERGT